MLRIEYFDSEYSRPEPEEVLVRRAKEGSKEAFCKLYGMYKDKLYRYAYYKLGNPADAEDAVSECVLVAWKDIGKLRSDLSFSAWIFRILHNICVGVIRIQIEERDKFGRLGDTSSGFKTVEDGTKINSSIELAEALSHLSEDEKEVVLLSVVSGLNSSEISMITGLTPGAARSKLSRSYAKMREFLKS